MFCRNFTFLGTPKLKMGHVIWNFTKLNFDMLLFFYFVCFKTQKRVLKCYHVGVWFVLFWKFNFELVDNWNFENLKCWRLTFCFCLLQIWNVEMLNLYLLKVCVFVYLHLFILNCWFMTFEVLKLWTFNIFILLMCNA